MFKYPQAWFALMLAALCLLGLSAWSSPVWYDDAGHHLVARHLSETGSYCYPVEQRVDSCDGLSQFITMGPALTYPVAAWMGAWGSEVIVPRLLIACISIAMLWLVLAISFQLFDQKAEEKGIATGALLLVNIQFLTYGAELLGEVPALTALLAGLWMFLAALRRAEFRFVYFAGAVVCFSLALLTKEYLLLPLLPALGLWAVVSLLRRNLAHVVLSLFLIVLLPLGPLLFHWVQCGSWEALMGYAKARSSYGNEFLALNLAESLRFLLLKPQILLGTAALLLKVWMRREDRDVFMLCMQGCLFIFFLLSAGYDRLGLLLLPLSLLYLSEFVVLLWQRVWLNPRRSRLLKGAMLIALLGLTSQQTFYRLGLRLSGRESNDNERWVAAWLDERHHHHIYTMDQQVVPFLSESVQVRLNGTVPSTKASCRPTQLKVGEYFIAGPYAFTEFQHCTDWSQLELLAATPDSVYQIFAAKAEF